MMIMEKLVFQNKEVYIIEKHHHALLPWTMQRRKMENAPMLFSFDYHLDNSTAFNYIIQFGKINVDEICLNFDCNDDDSVSGVVHALYHNEQFDAAIKFGLIDKVFVINYSQLNDIPSSFEMDEYLSDPLYGMKYTNIEIDNSVPDFPQMPFTYPSSENNIYIVGTDNAVPLIKEGDDIDIRRRCDMALETKYLEIQFSKIKDMLNNKCKVFSSPYDVIDKNDYILDIDLDYFQTRKSIDPNNILFFNRLIQNALMITVSMERDCVESVKFDNSYDASELLKVLISNIKSALR